jgi:hypothetical protein
MKPQQHLEMHTDFLELHAKTAEICTPVEDAALDALEKAAEEFLRAIGRS